MKGTVFWAARQTAASRRMGDADAMVVVVPGVPVRRVVVVGAAPVVEVSGGKIIVVSVVVGAARVSRTASLVAATTRGPFSGAPSAVPAVIPAGQNTISSDVTITYEIK